MGLITTRTRFIPPAEEGLPALAVHITQLVDSYMVWVGTTETTAATVENAPRAGSLCRDWACAMPPGPGHAMGPATTLYRTGGSDVASAMAQRLARRVGKAVFLSVDVADGLGARVLLEAERGVVATVVELETSSSSSSAATTL